MRAIASSCVCLFVCWVGGNGDEYDGVGWVIKFFRKESFVIKKSLSFFGLFNFKEHILNSLFIEYDDYLEQDTFDDVSN